MDRINRKCAGNSSLHKVGNPPRRSDGHKSKYLTMFCIDHIIILPIEMCLKQFFPKI